MMLTPLSVELVFPSPIKPMLRFPSLALALPLLPSGSTDILSVVDSGPDLLCLLYKNMHKFDSTQS